MSTYQSLPTLAGKAKIAAAIAGGPALNITQMAVGDGNGQPVTPLETQAALVNEVWRGVVTSVSRDLVHTNQVVVVATIPLEAGPFMIRELGLYDAAGTLIAVGSVPQVEKTALSQGSGQTLDLTFILVVDTAAQLTIILDAKPQSDWAEEDTQSLAYIRNKPEIGAFPPHVAPDRIIATRKGLTGGGDLGEDRIHDIEWANLDAAASLNMSDRLALKQAAQGEVPADHRSATLAQLATLLGVGTLPGYLGGLEVARTGALTFSVAAGAATSDDGATLLRLGASLTKTLAGNFAPGNGNGCLDAGAVAGGSWVHLHLIRRAADGVVDVLGSLSATAPVLPAGWGAPRLVWSLYVTGAGAIRPFVQRASQCFWTPVVQTLRGTGLVTNVRSLVTLDVPRIAGVVANVEAFAYSPAAYPGDVLMNLTDPATPDVAITASGGVPTSEYFAVTTYSSSGGNTIEAIIGDVSTDDQGRVAARLGTSLSCYASIDTRGFTHPRRRA